ncbi:nascent polypeptide-associated complex subunit alpha, muscle-specific form [Rhipicephalus sanguineus]|uniref:Transmembrane protein n=1 Tax=Rhipicephalus sanguineus TaxID=34632 RepID=A0A9D4QEW7_RHISA|nr:nascent polypeptide-associated complex subunit alpha, muscle-specific form [Rhipicephalus sanguineus]KAH7976656.1 hypothetical protein HPB52_017536 [Rhipicephalus sanguineus]
MSNHPPTKYPSAPSVRAQSEGSTQEAPWQTAMRYFTDIYANGSQQPPQGGGHPTTAEGPLSDLQKALTGWMGDRTVVRASVTVESSSASNSTAARDEQQSPLSKALDYLSLTVFAPEMLPSSDSRSSMGVTVVRPPSRSCLRDVRSAPRVSARSAVSAPARPLGHQRYHHPRPVQAPRLSAPAIRNRYRLKVVPSAVQRKARPPPRRAPSSTPSQLSLPSSQSFPQCHYVNFPDGRPACCVLLPPSAPPSCCSECRCGNRFPDPLEIFRTFSLAYNTFRLQQSPFGMTSLSPYWPMPQHPYYYYPPGPIVMPFQTWMDSRSADSSRECKECEREERKRRLAPAKAMHDFSTLVQVVPKGKRSSQKAGKNRALSNREAIDTVPSKMSNSAIEPPATVAPGQELVRKELQLLSESIDADPDVPASPAAPEDSQAIQQMTVDGSKEVPKAMPSAEADTAERAASPSTPKATSPSATSPQQPAEALSQVQPHLVGVMPARQANEEHCSPEPKAQELAGPESTRAAIEPRLPSPEQSRAHEGMQPGVHEKKQPAVQGKQLGEHEDKHLAMQGKQTGAHEEKQSPKQEGQPGAEKGKPNTPEKQHAAAEELESPGAHEVHRPGTQEERRPGEKEEKVLGEHGGGRPGVMQPAAQGKQPGKHEGNQAGSEVCSPLDPTPSPGQQHSSTNKGLATENMAASPSQGRPPAQKSPETRTSAPQSPSSPAALPEHSTTEFSPELTIAPPRDLLRPPDDPGTGAKPLSPNVARQNAPEEGDNESIAGGPIAANTAAVARDGDDNSDGPSEKSSDEAGAVETASQHPDHGDKAEEHLGHQEESSNGHHIVDMMHAEGSKPDEHAIGIEPANGALPAPGNEAKPEENAAHAEQGDQKPGGAGAATAPSPPNNINGAIMNCACVVVIAIIVVLVYSIVSSTTAKPPQHGAGVATPRVTLMFDIEHYNGSYVKADEEETTHIDTLDI